MKRTKKPKLQLGPAPGPQTCLRRCHMCGFVTETDLHDVTACGSCGKSMAPFYFFNDKEVAPHSDSGVRPVRPEGKVRPILGFTAYW